jgi:hypothetical protein
MAISTSSIMLQQQFADAQKARDMFNRIGYIPQGGPRVTHGDVNRAVDIGGARTSIEAGPGNIMTAVYDPFAPKYVQGLGIDLNRDGKFEHGTDGHLALDIDGNGIYDRNDIQDTLDMLRIFSGATNDMNKTGGFNQANQAKILLLQARGKQADLNQDGVLSSWELAKMGGKVVVDEPRAVQGKTDGNGLSVARDFSPNLVARDLPGANIPDYKPRTHYHNHYHQNFNQVHRPSPFGYPPFGGGQMGPPAFFNHFLHNMFSMMSFFARQY